MDIKKIGIAGALVVALFAGGYATGRYAAPERVVITEKVKEVKSEKIVESVDTAKILNALKTMNVAKDVHTVKIIERAPDGTTKTIITSDDKTKSESKSESQEKTKTVETKVVERIVYKEREVTKTVERIRPQWALALQPGFEFGAALGLGGQPFNLLSAIPVKHVMANVLLERRLLGPVFVGAWANTHLDGGLSVRVEW